MSAAAVTKGKTLEGEVEEATNTRIRITLTSTNVKNLEKGKLSVVVDLCMVTSEHCG